MAELFPMAQVAHVRPDAHAKLDSCPFVCHQPCRSATRGSRYQYQTHQLVRIYSVLWTLSLLTAGSQLRRSTDNLLAEMRAQMAVDRKQQATDRREETYCKYCMEKLPLFHDLKEWDIWWRKTRNMLGHEAWGKILVKPWENVRKTSPSRESSTCAA
jgi:hypothetical protein